MSRAHATSDDQHTLPALAQTQRSGETCEPGADDDGVVAHTAGVHVKDALEDPVVEACLRSWSPCRMG